MVTPSHYSLAKRLARRRNRLHRLVPARAPIVAETLAREGFNTVASTSSTGCGTPRRPSRHRRDARRRRGAGRAHSARRYAVASRVLDMGAEGIIAPMINTVADARAFVSATKFPPLGERSWGPQRAMTLAGVTDAKAYLRDANENIVTLAMIETKTAMDNLDAIAGTPGIDVLFVGPSDLSIGLSNGAELDPHSATVETALDKIVAAANKAGKIAGLYCANAQRAVACAKRGIRFLAVGSDLASCAPAPRRSSRC